MKEYKGYRAQVEFDESIDTFVGRVVGLKDEVTFQATSVKALEREFHTSVDVYLDFCKERGESPDRPCSGQFRLRIDPELHREVARAADRAGTSINTYAITALSKAVQS
jgi:predicted HicB family RNase H-like nuclease